VRDDGIVDLAIRGNINRATFKKLQAWTEEVKNTLKDVHTRNPKRVLVLLDHSDVAQVSVLCSGELHNLLRHNKDMVTRTAIYGANTLSRALLKMSMYITGRTNMKLFRSKKDAIDWLREIDNRKHR